MQKQKLLEKEKSITLKFNLGELPSDERSFVPAKAEIAEDPLGLRLENLSSENSPQSDQLEGVLVVRVAPGSTASGKIVRGDIINEVRISGKRYKVMDVDDFYEVIEPLSTGTKIAIVGRRSGNRFFAAVTVE